MLIYNSRSGKKEKFKPINPGVVTMYVCGPTLYSQIHIGNARPLIFFDVVARYFTHMGYEVKYVSNITDIDDKIIDRSLELAISEEQLVDDNLVMYNKVRSDLNLIEPLKMPMVTDYINEIIEYIQTLIDNQSAYSVLGDVYFSVNKIENYGAISNRNLEQLQAGNRTPIDSKKQYEHDFVLWKKTDKGVKWEAPFGAGRPGWHTECVVMINHILGSTIDIHGGGMDLKFPHHENEEAQSLACGCHLSNIWMHNGFVNIEDTKMSKSLGNVVYPQAIIDQYGANFLRLLMLKSSYRGPINISDDVKLQVQKDSEKLKRYVKQYGIASSYHQSELITVIEEEMNNDFNTANSLSKFFKIMASDESALDKQNLQTFVYQVFGFVDESEVEEKIPAQIEELINARAQAKKAKDFGLADQIREQIEELGYIIKDTREGVQCHKK